MMGAPVVRQDRLFYEFDLEDVVPPDHLLRRIDAVLDLSWLRDEMEPHYTPSYGRRISVAGTPAVYPHRTFRFHMIGVWFYFTRNPAIAPRPRAPDRVVPPKRCQPRFEAVGK